ncbi:hypothetical protein IQ255_11535 [Pleurocapsales cyanobacterium LEGE 10410]|nr:hypothetical protein [Pleurocapsales cyanobacterium LEGE 10410]
MNKLPDEKELKALVAMAKELETQIKEQSEIARKLAIDCEETINKEPEQQKTQKKPSES